MGMRTFFKRLRRAQGGNAAMLIGLGMPTLIGGTGLAVDTAQWYLWKRELQYATDQAAIAGAWAISDENSKDIYGERATQEFNANVGVTSEFATTPNVSLADYNGVEDSSVLVTASASKSLPFTGYLIGSAVTINVSAQATFVPAAEFTACMLALDPDADSAFILGGSVSGNAQCGFGALSDSATAMVKNGNPDINAGQLISSGGIDPGFGANGTIFEEIGSLQDPFEGLSPPDDPTPRVYSCPAASPARTTTTADVTINKDYNYEYYQGRNKSQASLQVGYIGRHSDYNTPGETVNQTVPDGSTAGTTTTYSPATFNRNDLVYVSGSGASSIWEWLQVRTETIYDNVQSVDTPAVDGVARPLPGTYASIEIDCDTEFQPGVYVVEGTLDFGDNVSVSGDDVMFVLQSADKIHVNDNSDLRFSGISSETLETTYLMDPVSASKLAGMLIYDPESTEQFKMNGRASLELDGILYMPGRNVWFNGTSNLSGSCLQIASGTITLNGTFNANIFCTSSEANPFAIGTQKMGVRLVA